MTAYQRRGSERLVLDIVRVAAIAASLALTACRLLPPLPSRGGPPWIELTTKHFILWTDAPAPRGREFIQELEHHRQIVLGVMKNADPPTPIFVVAFRESDELHAFIPAYFVAQAWEQSNPSRQPIVAITADLESRQQHNITHELTHVLTQQIIPYQPDWFSEGMAGYFETATLGDDGETVSVGEPREVIASNLRFQSATRTGGLLKCHRCAVELDMFYATTWAMVSYLLNKHLDEFQRYMEHLIELPRGHEYQAWHDIFPNLSGEEFDSELANWLDHGNLIVMHYRVKKQEWPVTQRLLTDSDVLAMRGLLMYRSAPNDSETRAQLEASLADDHTNLLARLVLTSITKSIAPEDARATAMAHLTDWRAWWLLWFALEEGPEARDAHEKLCGLIGNAPLWEAELCASNARPQLPE